MGETRDYDPGPFRDHDFTQATRNYQQRARARVEEAKETNEPASNLIPVSISTDCLWPLLIPADVTGSVGHEWLKFMFGKFPYLFNEGKTYMGPGLRICFGAIGDSHQARLGGPPDKYYFQAVDFVDASGAAQILEKKLICEGGGGGQAKEDYQLWALYALKNVFFPKARRKPLMIITGDEAPYELVTKEEASKIHVDLKKNMSTDEIFEALKAKYTVYMVRKGYENFQERDIHRRWVKLLGDSRVCVMQKPDRIVDVMFGIMAKESGKIPYYLEEMKRRQKPKQCQEAFSVLESIFADETPDDFMVEQESDEGVATSPLG